MALLMLVLCTAMIGSRLQPALVTANVVDHVRDDLSEQSAFNRVSEVWARLGSCSSESGVLCQSTGASACDCDCTVSGAAQVRSVSNGGVCTLLLKP